MSDPPSVCTFENSEKKLGNQPNATSVFIHSHQGCNAGYNNEIIVSGYNNVIIESGNNYVIIVSGNN